MKYKSDHARIVDLEDYVTRLQLTVARIIEYNELAVKPKPNLPDNTCDTADPPLEILQPPVFDKNWEIPMKWEHTEITVNACGIPNRLRNPKEVS